MFPFVHLQRSFMHLGFHIYDLGFQSQNSEAAKPMVFTTTMLLILIIVVLNLTAVRRAHEAAAEVRRRALLMGDSGRAKIDGNTCCDDAGPNRHDADELVRPRR